MPFTGFTRHRREGACRGTGRLWVALSAAYFIPTCAPTTMSPSENDHTRQRTFRQGAERHPAAHFQARGCTELLRLSGGWDSKGGGGRLPAEESEKSAGPFRTLATTGHSHMSFYGFMWDVRATRGDLAITNLEMAGTTLKQGPFLYNVYVSNAAATSCLEIKDRQEVWRLVGTCRTKLPWRSGQTGHWGALQLDSEILVRDSEITSIYVHCPESAEGVAYRSNIDDINGVTDADAHLEIHAGYPSFSLTPFKDVHEVDRGFAGVVRYRLLSS